MAGSPVYRLALGGFCDERGEVADFLFRQLILVGGHAAAAVRDLVESVLVGWFGVVEVRPNRAG